MPRAFDSDEPSGIPRFTENVTCPRCGEIFESWFHDDSSSLSVQDMTDPSTGVHDCPSCNHTWASQATGWSFFSEAG